MARIDSLPAVNEQNGVNVIKRIWNWLSEKPKNTLAVVFAAVLLSWGFWFKAVQNKAHSEIQIALSAHPSITNWSKKILWLEEAILRECSQKNSSFIDEMTVICKKNSALFLWKLIREIAASPTNPELQKLDSLFENVRFENLSEEWKKLITTLVQEQSFGNFEQWKMPNLQKILEQVQKLSFTTRTLKSVDPKSSFSDSLNTASKWFEKVTTEVDEFETKNAERTHAEYVKYASREVLKELELYKKVLQSLSLDTSGIDTAISWIVVTKWDDKNPLSDIPFDACIRLIGMQNNWPNICDNIQWQVVSRVLSYAQSSTELREAEWDTTENRKEATKEETRLFRSIQKILWSNNQWLIGEVIGKIPERYAGLTSEDIITAKKFQVTPKSRPEYNDLKSKIEEEIVIWDVHYKKFTLINEANLSAKNLARALVRSPYKENVEWILSDISWKSGGVFQEMLKKYYESMKPKKRS